MSLSCPDQRLSYAHNFSSGSAAAILLEAVRLIAPPLMATLPAKGRGEGARSVYLRGSRRDGISPALIQNCGCRHLSPPLCGERRQRNAFVPLEVRGPGD